MKCQDCELLLEEYLDGELDARASTTVGSHLASCASCTEAYDSLLAEQSLYSAYEREVEVTPALWAGVEERIRGAREADGGKVGFLQRLSRRLAPLLVAPRFSPAMTAAMLVLTVGVTVGVMKFLGARDDQASEVAKINGTGTQPTATVAPAEPSSPVASPTGEQRVAPSPEQTRSPAERKPQLAAGPPPKKGIREKYSPDPILNAKQDAERRREQSPDQLVREAEQRYIAAIRILERDVNDRRSRIDPQTRARFDETLASIDRTISETRKTVRQHGNDPVAVQYMLSAYAKKVEVMREMAHIGQGN